MNKKIDFYHINRGGDITFHGPEQIVGYPLLDLDQFFTDIHKFLRTLEDAINLTLLFYNIESVRLVGYTGVRLDTHDSAKARKICALGIKCCRWVAMLGLAFKINTNLNYFENIVPCGIDDNKVSSMQKELGINLDISYVSEELHIHLSNLFGWRLIF